MPGNAQCTPQHASRPSNTTHRRDVFHIGRPSHCVASLAMRWLVADIGNLPRVVCAKYDHAVKRSAPIAGGKCYRFFTIERNNLESCPLNSAKVCILCQLFIWLYHLAFSHIDCGLQAKCSHTVAIESDDRDAAVAGPARQAQAVFMRCPCQGIDCRAIKETIKKKSFSGRLLQHQSNAA
jgi:hypothetical protein